MGFIGWFDSLGSRKITNNTVAIHPENSMN